MRRGRILAGTLTAAIIATGALGVTARIEPLLPQEGASVCYAGEFGGDQSLTFGWPHEHRTDQARVTGLTLRLERPSGQTPHRDTGSGYNFDWRYAFSLLMETSDRGTFRAGGECDWSQGALAHVEWELYCFIDCDGGGIALSRLPGREALDVTWEKGGWLRMSGCGDGGAILRSGDGARSFPITRVVNRQCSEKLSN